MKYSTENTEGRKEAENKNRNEEQGHQMENKSKNDSYEFNYINNHFECR